MDAPRRSVVFIDIHAGDAPSAVGNPPASHPVAGDLVGLLGRDGVRCYEVERVDHDFSGGRHVARVFVERADPFRPCPTRTTAPRSPCPRVVSASDSPASARLVV